ncbi:MAG TPA: peroxidase-related enzyme [Thermoanaerobaculia bacterium]|nr:peroxidase-related enzyme [Thermoanaerobaculia bacterium]
MSQPPYLHALDLPAPPEEQLSPETRAYLDKCREKLGLVPNVIAAYTFDEDKLRGFTGMYNGLMLGPSGLSKLEREMIAVVVSAINRCYYCLVAHGAAVRELSGDPVLGEILTKNYRVAELPARQRAMLDFAVKMSERSHEIEEPDRQALRDVGLSDAEIWDLAAVTSFFNMSNRMASAIDMMPNLEYHGAARADRSSEPAP